MKQNIFRLLCVACAGILFFASCEKEPEYGTPLFPVEEEDLRPKAYINENGAKINYASVDVVKTPASLVNPEQSFYVRLNKVSDKDVTVKAVVNDELARENNEGAVVVTASDVAFQRQEVVIKAGSMISDDPVVFTLAESYSQALENGATVVACLTLESLSEEIALGKNFNVYTCEFNKMELNIYDGGADGSNLEP